MESSPGEQFELLTRTATTGKRFVVHAAEKLSAFVELEAAVKLDWYRDTNWVLFDPNDLQRFAQQKGGFMKKRRGEVLKRLCRSSYCCGRRNSDRENQMKTKEHLEAIAAFIQRVTAAVSELKDHLQQDYERTYPDLGEIIRIVLDEEEAKAWELSFFPHLFLPDMVEAHIANLNLQPVETKHEDVFERLHRKANGFHHERIRLRKTAVQS
jgi:hypothetical protein